jgi:C-terminal, D2-small domain, of ClpB protein
MMNDLTPRGRQVLALARKEAERIEKLIRRLCISCSRFWKREKSRIQSWPKDRFPEHDYHHDLERGRRADQTPNGARIWRNGRPQLVRGKDIKVQLDRSAVEFLIDKGYDPTRGARPMRRAVEKFLGDPLAEEFLRGKIRQGDTLEVQAAGEQLALKVTVAGTT